MKSTTNPIIWDSIPIDYVDKVGHEPTKDEQAKLDKMWDEIYLCVKTNLMVGKLEKEIEDQNRPASQWYASAGFDRTISGGYSLGKFSVFAGSSYGSSSKSTFMFQSALEVIKTRKGAHESMQLDTEGT